MFWKYTRKDTKVMLSATLLLFASYAVFVAQSWEQVIKQDAELTANTVGIFVGVEENELNNLVSELDAREKNLEEREATFVNARTVTLDKKILLMMSLMGIGLLGLILLNFYLDSKRRMNLAG